MFSYKENEENGNDILMYDTHLWIFIRKLKRHRGVGAGVSKILTCLPDRSGPHRSILERSFLRQKCVKLKNFNRWVHLKSRNWDTALLCNFMYHFHQCGYIFKILVKIFKKLNFSKNVKKRVFLILRVKNRFFSKNQIF